MNRVEDWPARLAAEIELASNRPFVWGSGHDCMGFAGACHRAMTGDSPIDKANGEYDSARGARKALKRYGFENVEEAMASEFEEIEPKLAQRGDMALFETGFGLGLGVCVGPLAALVSESGGVAYQPMSKALRAWKVG